MCGAGQAGSNGGDGFAGNGGGAGRVAQKTFLSASLPSTVAVTCGTSTAWGNPSNLAQSSFGTYLYASGPSGGPNDEISASTLEAANSYNYPMMYGNGGSEDVGFATGKHGSAFQGGGGGAGGSTAQWGNGGNGWPGGKAATNKTDLVYVAEGGGGAGGASGPTGAAGTPGGYDPITGFGNGGGGGGEGVNFVGGNGGAAVRGGGGGGGGCCALGWGPSLGGAGGDGFVRVRTLCYDSSGSGGQPSLSNFSYSLANNIAVTTSWGTVLTANVSVGTWLVNATLTVETTVNQQTMQFRLYDPIANAVISSSSLHMEHSNEPHGASLSSLATFGGTQTLLLQAKMVSGTGNVLASDEGFSGTSTKMAVVKIA